MLRILRALRGLQEVLTTAGAVLAAAVIAVETYRALRKKMSNPGTS